MATIQTRLTSDNKQHDEAFKKSKQEVYNYQKKVDSAKVGIKSFASGITGKLIPALGLAGGALGAFNKLLQNNDVLADEVGRKMNVLKSSVNAFAGECTRFNSSSFISKLKDIKRAAEDTYNALDNLGTFNTAYSFTNSKKMARVNELREKKAAGKLTNDDRAELKQLYNEIDAENKKQIKQEEDVISSLLNKYRAGVGYSKGQNKNSSGNYSKELGNVDLINVIRMAAQGDIDFDEMRRMWKHNDKMLDFYNYLQSYLDSDDFKLLFEHLTSREQIKEKNANDKRSIDRVLSSSGSGKLPKAKKNLGIVDATKLAGNNGLEMLSNYNDMQATISSFSAIEVQSLDEVNERLEEFRRNLRVGNKENLFTQLQEDADNLTNSLYSLSYIFSNLGDVMNDDKGFNIAGIITETIAKLLQGYATATLQSASLGPLGWAAFSLSGLAQVTAMISQIHNLSGYANGGIIGGNSYVGDRMLARVNSGEMILNQSQQANLFDMINNGAGGGNVVFKIEGSQLVGVLNNYNKKTGRVR